MKLLKNFRALCGAVSPPTRGRGLKLSGSLNHT